MKIYFYGIVYNKDKTITKQKKSPGQCLFNLENNIINNNAGKKKSVCFQYHYLKSKSCFLEKPCSLYERRKGLETK